MNSKEKMLELIKKKQAGGGKSKQTETLLSLFFLKEENGVFLN